jgi:murein DD-endopeptidase MepM/ murein hydrolase activator NlpD
MMIVGFYFGVLIHSFLVGSYEQAFTNPYTFNYIIVATALCGIFLLPTLRNFFIALGGVAISVVLVDAINILFNYYSIPVFTLPFNITVITFIFLLSMLYYKEFNYNIKYTPEESLSSYLSSVFRFGTNMIKISLPFSGEWSVYQAFDGEWTHKGNYKYAYDFVKVKNAKTYKNEGSILSDYYAFGESILSPVSGYVVDARDDLVDNVIGEVDRVNNWGNYIIIKSDLGFFVEISHLMQHSLMAKVGDYVKLNQVIAKCGNSGYSPEPHIHIQVQEVGVINAFTKEFLFNEYYVENRLLFNSLPKKDELVKSIIINKNIYSRLIFILDDEFIYDLYRDDKLIGEYGFSVKMNSKGEFYFEDRDKNQLYFYTDTTMFYFYSYIGKESYLKKLFILVPRIPYIHRKSISFVDYIPANLINSKIKTIMIELLSIINKDYYKIQEEYIFDKNKVVSKNGKIELSLDKKGFGKIEYKNIKLIRRKI